MNGTIHAAASLSIMRFMWKIIYDGNRCGNCFVSDCKFTTEFIGRGDDFDVIGYKSHNKNQIFTEF